MLLPLTVPESVDQNPDKPECPVNTMDKNQKRHFRCKVQDYKLKNNVLCHLHTYTEIVQGETVKRCKYFNFFPICIPLRFLGFFTSLYTTNIHKNRKHLFSFLHYYTQSHYHGQYSLSSNNLVMHDKLTMAMLPTCVKNSHYCNSCDFLSCFKYFK